MYACTHDTDVVRAIRQWIGTLDAEWCRDNGDSGLYYAPRIERGTVIRAGGDGGDFGRVIWPNSTIAVYSDCVKIEGRRGSIEDVIIPVLRELGHHPKDRPNIWDVYTTRPDVEWWTRCPTAYEESLTDVSS